MRPLNENEIKLIHLIASELPHDAKTRLLTDLARAEVDTSKDIEDIICFRIRDYVRPAYVGQHTYGVDGYLKDSDGAPISALLFADRDDHLLEMELIRLDGEPIINPSWATLVSDKDVVIEVAQHDNNGKI